MKILLVRHGLTQGNITKKFIGRTDDPLCDKGIVLLRGKREVYITEIFDNFHLYGLYVSPMTRCIESAKILFPEADYQVIEGLKECDFGLLEGKNHQELADVPEYIAFVNEENPESFPGGESINGFMNRCAEAFEHCVRRSLGAPENVDCDPAAWDSMALDSLADSSFDTSFFDKKEKLLAFVVHGGTMMGIMDRFAKKDKEIPYYKWNVDNGCGYICDLCFKEDGEIILDDIHEIG